MKRLEALKNFLYNEIKKNIFKRNKKEQVELTFGYNEEMEEYVEYYQLATRWK